MHILLVDSKLCIGMYIPDGDTSKELPAYLCERRHNQRFIPYVNCLHQPAFEIALKTVGKYLNTARGFEIEKQIKNIFFILVLYLIMLVGISGNLSIIIIITKNKLLRQQVTNLFLLNMAIADALNLVFNPIFYYFRNNVIFTSYLLDETLCVSAPAFLSK